MRLRHIGCYYHILLTKQFIRTLWHSRRNVIADTNDLPPPAGPYMAEFDITYRCNCRCRMCQRWQDLRSESLTASDYRRLSNEFKKMAVHQISIAGGEPLVRQDVFEIIRNFAAAGLSVNLCTNGMLVKKYADRIIDSGATCVTVSLDGASADRHDNIRGVRGAYALVEEGIFHLLAQRRTWRPILRVRMTLSKFNQHEIHNFINKWQGVVDDVLLQPVHHCGDAYYTGMSPADFRLDPTLISDQLSGTSLADDAYMATFINTLRTGHTYPKFRCFAGVLMVRIDPWGNVFPCLEQHIKIGSLKNQSFRTLWHSAVFNQERERLRSQRSCRCWYNNTALIGYYGSWLSRGRLRQKDATAVVSTGKAMPCYVPLKPVNKD